MNRKDAGGKQNVLIHYVDVCAPNLFGVVLCNQFIGDILWFIFVKILTICVPTTLAKRILFLSHMNRKDAGSKHNVLVHYVDVGADNSGGKGGAIVTIP